MVSSFEELINRACDAKEIPGIVLLAVDKSGKFEYQNAFGFKSPTELMSLDSTFIMASCTKLMTSISALQCVERGQIGLDDDVSTVLVELKDAQILTGFEEGTDEPILIQARKKITLRHLLTHTSGISYDMLDPRLQQWRKFKGQQPGTRGLPMMDRLAVPLLFEPGTSWTYGMSTDWVGVLVARLNKTTLEEYMENQIWTPLGIKDITFHSELKPDLKKKLVTMTYRDGVDNPQFSLPSDTNKPVLWTEELVYDDPIPIGEEYGGQGSMGSGIEYIKILKSLLLDDSRLLLPSTLDSMFTPQLGEASRSALTTFYEAPFWADTFASHPIGTKLDWGLAGMLILNDEETGKKKGTLTWSGLPNLLWTIDREAGLATFYAGNVLPFGDYRSHKYQQAFEKEMYSRLERS